MRRGFLAFLAFAIAASATAQTGSRLVVDQAGLPIPGVHLTLFHGDQPVDAAVASDEGRFAFPGAQSSDVIEAAADGFETVRVQAIATTAIVLRIAAARARSEVTASALAATGAASQQIGATLTAASAAALPSAHHTISESLPLLPSVLRGADGLLRIGGTRPHESALWIDGFDITDPVTGVSSIDLPFEAVKGVSVLRDPMAATYGGTLGAAASIETAAGGDQRTAGVEEFVPEPRLSRTGFGQIEGFFPRVFAGGRTGAVRYFAANEMDVESVVVPGVTGHNGGPTIGSLGNTSFGRVDVQFSPRHSLTIEGLGAPSRVSHAGLSPVRDAAASPLIRRADAFVGAIERVVVGARDLLTFRFGATRHRTALHASSDAPARLTPDGWRDNAIGSLDRHAGRESVAVSWDRAGIIGAGRHDLTVTGEWQARTMRGVVQQYPVQVDDASGQLLRLVEFSSGRAFERHDAVGDALARDAWRVSERIQLDAGARVDWYGGQAIVSPRLGARVALDASGETVMKAGAGRFVGRLPLGALAFNALPSRRDASFDPATSATSADRTEVLALGTLDAPRADALTIEIDRHIEPGLDLQFEARRRIASRLATLDVPASGGTTTLASTGRSAYRELAVSVRRQWQGPAQIFASYVHSTNRSELNDFGAVFDNLMAPYLEPGARTRSADDVPHRVVAWGTLPLPQRIVVAPALEWRSGFPYARVDAFRHYDGAPNTDRFPAFMSLDVLAYRTVDIRHHLVDLGAQVFNATRHFNPRDVLPVSGTPLGRRFTNSVGITIDGYMMVKWD